MRVVIPDCEAVGLTPYGIAWKFKWAGIPIEFNAFDAYLRPEDIRIVAGEIRSHYDPAKAETVFEWRG